MACSTARLKQLSSTGSGLVALPTLRSLQKGHGLPRRKFFQGLLPAELPSSHPLLWPHGVDAEGLLAGSVHGKEVAEDLLSAGGSS